MRLLTLLTDDFSDMISLEFIQNNLFSNSYWIIVIALGLAWLIGSLPAFTDSDLIKMFKNIAGTMCLIMLVFFYVIKFFM